MINYKENIDYYIKNRIKPIEVSYFVTLKPEYLKKFKNKENILCRIHGNHKDWALRNKGNFKKNPSIRCKLCSNLSAKYWHRTRKIKSLFKDARNHAKDNNSIFTIKITDIFNKLKEQKLKCAISNVKFDRFINKVSIDKISPPKGYTKKNIQFLTIQINKMKNKFDQKYFINLCKDIYKFRILDKGKYGSPIFNFDYEKELIMGTSTAYGLKLRLKRLKNNQSLFCKKHGFHKLFRIDKWTFIKCKKCDRESSIEYQKKIKLDPDFNKKTKQKMFDKVSKFKTSGKSTCAKHGYGNFFRIKVSKWRVKGVNKKSETLICRKCDIEYGKVDRKNNPLKWCYMNRKSERRRSVNKKFHLKYEDILLQYKKQNGRCYYTGIPLDKIKNRPSLERLDNEKEYTVQNVVLTNFQSNKCKSDLSYSEFIKNIKLIYNHNFK